MASTQYTYKHIITLLCVFVICMYTKIYLQWFTWLNTYVGRLDSKVKTRTWKNPLGKGKTSSSMLVCLHASKCIQETWTKVCSHVIIMIHTCYSNVWSWFYIIHGNKTNKRIFHITVTHDHGNLCSPNATFPHPRNRRPICRDFWTNHHPLPMTWMPRPCTS